MQRGHEQERVGDVIGGKWTLERLIGVGGMAAVYAARHHLGTTAAIKILHPQYARLNDLRRRFEREALVMGRLEHPSTVEVRDIDVTEDGSPYIVMELLEGRPLSQCMREGNGVSVPEILTYADQTLSVLVAAHAQGIVHRDIKPDNLFVTHAGQLKVLDFGVARMLETSGPGQGMTAAGTRLGTLPYMPPEQVLGGDIDGRADLFSLGAVMYKVMAGRRVHECATETELIVKMAKDPAPPLCEVAPQVPVSVGQVVDCALALRRDERYPDARSMQADIQAVLGGRRPTHARPPRRAPITAAETKALTAGAGAAIVRAGEGPVSPTRATVVGGISPTAATVIPGMGPTLTPVSGEEPTRVEGAIARSEPPPAPAEQTTGPMHTPPAAPMPTLVSASTPEPTPHNVVNGTTPAVAAESLPYAAVAPGMAPASGAIPPSRTRERSGTGRAVAVSLLVGVVGVAGAWVLFGPDRGEAATEETSDRKAQDDDDGDRKRYEPVDLDDEELPRAPDAPNNPSHPGQPAGPQSPAAPKPAPVLPDPDAPAPVSPAPVSPAPKPAPPPLSDKERKKLERERKKAEKKRKKKRGKD